MVNPPCVIHEDDHLLVINKPPGINTHASGPRAPEGIYDWLRNREPRFARLSILQRLDKQTSGVLLFGKSDLTNRSLTQQFENHAVHKTYYLLSAVPPPVKAFTVESNLFRVGEKYKSGKIGDQAVTRFTVIQETRLGWLIRAEPKTGKTHQIRVHASENGFPVSGDALYGGSPAPRLFLHAEQIVFQHPASREETRFTVPHDFEADPRRLLRAAFISRAETNGYRVRHGASDATPGLYVDRLGEILLAESATDPFAAAASPRLSGASQAVQPFDAYASKGCRPGGSRRFTVSPQVSPETELKHLMNEEGATALFFKHLRRQIRNPAKEEVSPRQLLGAEQEKTFLVRENGMNYLLRLDQGYSTGLFLDQRDNRSRLLSNYAGPTLGALFPEVSRAEVLNCFSYTCSFSVCAAKAGARTVSVDLSKKVLDWGKENFALNELATDPHQFIYGDVFNWLGRFAKKNRCFDLVLLDPPTFSRSKEGGSFQVEKDYPRLVKLALPLIKKGGILFASTNSATWSAEDFRRSIDQGALAAGRKIVAEQFCSQPPDFPVTRQEPAYLKTFWLRV